MQRIVLKIDEFDTTAFFFLQLNFYPNAFVCLLLSMFGLLYSVDVLTFKTVCLLAVCSL